jgi:hypothetical protein
MSEPSEDIAKILAHIDATIGEPHGWGKWPGGWPDDIEAALVYAVFSARAVYRSARGRGIYANVVEWRHARGRQRYSLSALVEEIDAAGVLNWAARFGNLQKSLRHVDLAGGSAPACHRICRMVSLLPQLVSAVHTMASRRCPSARHSRSASDRPVPGVQVTAACSASATLTGSRWRS